MLGSGGLLTALVASFDANGNTNVLGDYVVHGNVFGNVNAVWIIEVLFQIFFLYV